MLTVRDIMHPDVVTVTADTSVRHLARILADAEISGAPVVDDEGGLLGVVSSTDVIRLAAEEDEVRVASLTVRPEQAPVPDPENEDGDDDAHGFFLPEESPHTGHRVLSQFPESALDTATVEEIMTPVSFTVEAHTSVKDVADFLVRGRIHRAVVMEDDQLLGIVTSNDVLRAVADGRLAG